ncbi:hypothetical protein CLF_112800 [Clonorchis sinensis]|uniref:Uncharacterized protein n=1 Tax=Clonorchis sinensis TaxID=79923 RepID=G7YX08_CLOSI|nr:hypothetical protein CLF_112800 [Clonorchis sinensis]
MDDRSLHAGLRRRLVYGNSESVNDHKTELPNSVKLTNERPDPAVAQFRYPTPMPLPLGRKREVLPSCPSLDRNSRDAEVGFERRTFRSVQSEWVLAHAQSPISQFCSRLRIYYDIPGKQLDLCLPSNEGDKYASLCVIVRKELSEEACRLAYKACDQASATYGEELPSGMGIVSDVTVLDDLAKGDGCPIRQRAIDTPCPFSARPQVQRRKHDILELVRPIRQPPGRNCKQQCTLRDARGDLIADQEKKLTIWRVQPSSVHPSERGADTLLGGLTVRSADSKNYKGVWQESRQGGLSRGIRGEKRTRLCEKRKGLCGKTCGIFVVNAEAISVVGFSGGIQLSRKKKEPKIGTIIVLGRTLALFLVAMINVPERNECKFKHQLPDEMGHR